MVFPRQNRLVSAFVIVAVLRGVSSNSIYQRESHFLFQQPHALYRITRDLTTNCGEGDAAPPNRVDTGDRLAELRAQMAAEGADAYLVPWDEEGRLDWISGFSGSAGDAAITQDQAALWTDGRYWLQASNQLDCNWQLMRQGEDGVPSKTEWLTGAANLTEGSKVAADPTLIGAKTWLDMEEELVEGGLEMVSLADNLVDRIWTEEDGRQPLLPKNLVVHSLEYAGQEYTEKLSALRTELSDQEFLAMVVTEGDEVAWLFNMRGEGDSVVESLMISPIFQSFALVTAAGATTVWLHTEKITAGLSEHLGQASVEIKEYDDFLEDLSAWAAGQDQSGKILLTNPSMYLTGASYAVYESLPEAMIKLEDSPILPVKAVKNAVEATGMASAHLRDAYAKCKFLAELEDDIVRNGNSQDWTEISAARRLSEFRAEQELSRGDSFTTIAASGANAAVIHYSPVEETDAKVNDSAVFLVDSGGQYLDGTTDVTRTTFFGASPPAELVDRYTRVLMGAIDLARATFPAGTLETAVDYATRQHLFNVGLDYNHGTGHGVGAYLSVHEGPINVRMSEGYFEAASLKENMFISDEPGYYKDNEYGIRIENVVQVVKKIFDDKPEEDGYLYFETVTLIPFEPKLINFDLMNREQIDWYNAYNGKIMEQVLPYFEDRLDAVTVDWLYAHTARVEYSGGVETVERKREL